MKLPLRDRMPAPERTPDGVMTLTEHLAELRVRIIRCALAIALGMILLIAFYDPVLRWLTDPYTELCKSKPPEFCGFNVSQEGQAQLFSFTPLQGFSTRMRISMYGGIVLAIPVLMWQIWGFIVPALKANEKKYAIPFITSSVGLFLLGGGIAYWTLEPALNFLISWAGDDVQSAFSVSSYVSLVALMVAAFGVGFQFPVLLVFLQLAGVLRPQQLLSWWRYATVVIVILAAVITPSGDPISLAALALPMFCLYFVAIGIGVIAQRRRATKSGAPA